jgi:hypothetical protein
MSPILTTRALVISVSVTGTPAESMTTSRSPGRGSGSVVQFVVGEQSGCRGLGPGDDGRHHLVPQRPGERELPDGQPSRPHASPLSGRGSGTYLFQSRSRSAMRWQSIHSPSQRGGASRFVPSSHEPGLLIHVAGARVKVVRFQLDPVHPGHGERVVDDQPRCFRAESAPVELRALQWLIGDKGGETTGLRRTVLR